MDNLDLILEKYHFSQEEKDELLAIIKPFYCHDEFQKRMTNIFPHHGNKTLGMHILDDAAVTYILCKKKKEKKKYYNLHIDLAVKIAMMHDLYTAPWQNNTSIKVKSFFHKHGFRHPVEAVINANYWFPEIFKDDNSAKIMIDGIIHHMWPLPVSSLKHEGINEMELVNYDFVEYLSVQNREYLIASLMRHKIGKISFCRSKYHEGRIMSKADKIVARKELTTTSSIIALITGKNKKLLKGKEDVR